jgi:ABC-type uncharacterized transport system ATPase component
MHNLSKVYRTHLIETHALRGFDIHVAKGEFVAVTGPSGSGKTTFLNIAGLLEEFTGGDYLLDGVNVKGMDDDARSKLRNEKLGFIFQGFNPNLSLFIALSYGGRWDIARAARRLAERAVAGEIQPAAIDEQLLGGELALAGVPDPDLFIRTGGEQRISNFVLWNLAYSELYFCDTLWPDFDDAELDRALHYFAARQRRFGLTGDQVAGG